MKLKRLQVTLEDKTDFSNKTADERTSALTELEQECINRIISGILDQGLVDCQIVETKGHGYRFTATLGVYDIRDINKAQEAPEAKTRKKKLRN